MNFADRLIKAVDEKQNPSCVGLDPRIDDIPLDIRKKATESHGNNLNAVSHSITEFNRKIIDAVKDTIAVVKPNLAFYECYGEAGMHAFVDTIHYAKSKGLITIADAKRGDIGSTAEAYAEGYLGMVTLADGSITPYINADAMTVNPYLSKDSVSPFMDVCKKHGKGIFIGFRKHNPTSSDIDTVNDWSQNTEGSSGYRFAGAIVTLAFSRESRDVIRNILKNSMFLVPGYGAQGGGPEDAVGCINKDGYGAVISSSRGITSAYKKSGKKFDEAAAEAAEKMKEDISGAMKAAGVYPW